MKLNELLEQTTRAYMPDQLEKILVKAYSTLKNTGGISDQGKALIKTITTKLINLVNDEKAFSKVYSEYLGKNPDAMDLYLEEVYSLGMVKNADEFFSKYFPKK